MNVSKYLLGFLISTAVIMSSCNSSADDLEKENCTEHFLNEFDMKAYSGEDLDCKTFIRLYQKAGIYYAVMDNHCVDFAAFTVYDCNGDEYCAGPCYDEDATDLGIIGIKE